MRRAILQLLPADTWLKLCAIGLGLILLVMPVHALVSTWGGTGLGPLWLWKTWKEIVLVVVAGLFGLWLARHAEQRKAFVREPLVGLAGIYILLTLALAVLFSYSNSLEATLAGVAMNLRYIVIALVAYGVIRFGAVRYEAYRSLIGRWLLGVGVGLAVFGLLQVTVLPPDTLTYVGYDKETTIAPYMLIDQNEGALRAFATLRGPNDYGAFLILPLLLGLMLMRRRRWVGAVVVCVIAAAIVASGSRSAWIGALLAIAVWVALRLGRRIMASRVFWYGALTTLVFAAGLIYTALHVPALRLAVFHSSPGDSSLTEGSTDQHWIATRDGIVRVVRDPLGCGPGCAGPASYYGETPRISENYVVQIAEEVGVFGLIVWLAIVGLVGYRLYTYRQDWLARALLASGVGLMAIGLWLHVWSDDPLSLTWWALAGVVLGGHAGARRRAKKSVS